jgi:hypothetical protein
MSASEIERYERLAALTCRVARAVAELGAARDGAPLLAAGQAEELAELAERAQALQVLLANEVERAWNAAEATARRARRAEMIGRVHDAVSAETTLPAESLSGPWLNLGPPSADLDPAGPPSGDLGPEPDPPR